MDKRFQKLLSEVLFTEMPGFSTEQVWQPPTDVFECENAYVLRMEIAGVRREDLNVDFSNDILTITGCRLECAKHNKVALRRLEISYGPFKRSVCLPGSVDRDRIEASYDNGFLEVLLPKGAPKRVSVNVDSED
jgi:HSP20 family protein